MIQLSMNGTESGVEPGSIEELRRIIEEATPPGEVRCVMRINGTEIGEERLDEFNLGAIRSLEVSTAVPAELARQCLSETRDWIERICGVLSSIADDYRVGREHQAASRLVSVVDALDVLVGLLGGIHSCIELEPPTRAALDRGWKLAEEELRASISGLVGDLEAGDPVRLADRAGHTLPRSLGVFRELLHQIRT
ncbi:MAG: hypothetical protein ACE5FG_03805 [Myxococcota bacterium]